MVQNRKHFISCCYNSRLKDSQLFFSGVQLQQFGLFVTSCPPQQNLASLKKSFFCVEMKRFIFANFFMPGPSFSSLIVSFSLYIYLSRSHCLSFSFSLSLSLSLSLYLSLSHSLSHRLFLLLHSHCLRSFLTFIVSAPF